MLEKQVNNTPVADDILIASDEDQSSQVELKAISSSNNPLTYALVTQPQYGQVQLNDSLVSYTPQSNYFGNDSFQYIANDGLDNSNVATVSLSR